MQRSSLFLLFLVLSSALWSQSFSDEKTYQVSGKDLNRLETDLLTAKSELTSLRARLNESETTLQSLTVSLSESKQALTTASASWKESQKTTLIIEGCLLVGGVIVGILLAH